MIQKHKAGDFTGLADDYSQNRPDYSSAVLNALLGLIGKPMSEVDFVDVGAGTGIWTRMVYEAGITSATAIEPNDDMRIKGIRDCQHTKIRWLAGNAETTFLHNESVDWLTMASSFHWVNFAKATHEFQILNRHDKEQQYHVPPVLIFYYTLQTVNIHHYSLQE